MTNITATQVSSRASEGMSHEELYPIREVSRVTGVNPVTLRAWERRYGLLVPHRTPSGHRLYSLADIERVRTVMRWIDRGVAVSKVASIIDRQVQPSVTGQGTEESASPHREDMPDVQQWQGRVIDAVNGFELRQLELIYAQIQGSYPLAVVLQEILLPVWCVFLERHQQGDSAQWGFLDGYLRSRLFQRLGYQRAGLPYVMLAALPGPQRELDVLMAAAFLHAADTNVIYLPTFGSASELVEVADRSECAVLVLYGARAAESELLRYLPRLQQALECPVAVAGVLCEAQPVELERAGLALLGEADQGLTAKMQALLAGRLDG